jgi:hypothetical protein
MQFKRFEHGSNLGLLCGHLGFALFLQIGVGLLDGLFEPLKTALAGLLHFVPAQAPAKRTIASRLIAGRKTLAGT